MSNNKSNLHSLHSRIADQAKAGRTIYSSMKPGPEGSGVMSPRPPGPNISDSLWCDAKLGRQQRGRARRLSTPLLKDVDHLVWAQPHSFQHHPRKLRERVDGNGRKLHYTLGQHQILVVGGILESVGIIQVLESWMCGWASLTGRH